MVQVQVTVRWGQVIPVSLLTGICLVILRITVTRL